MHNLNINFTSEYKERIKLYSDNIWTCQCTGHINLTHKEATESEAAARKTLKDSFSSIFEKPVLEEVHHSE